MSRRLLPLGVAAALTTGLGFALTSRAQEVVPPESEVANPWFHENLDGALAAARATGKPVLVAFR